MNFASDYNRLELFFETEALINDDNVGCISIKTKWWKFQLSMSIVLFLILFVVSLSCLYFAIVCLIVACRENDLPDIEDLETRQDS